jgi:hypothetical protein
MTPISDEYMRQMIATTKSYCIVMLRAGPNRNMPGVEKIIWEHARRNFSLRAEGKLSIVCPVNDGSDLCGLGIFHTDMDEARSIMEKDPGILQKVFTCELHLCRSFPGDKVPG